MFEKEISNYAFNIAKGYTGESVPLSSLMIDVDLPGAFKKFAEAEVEEMLDDEGLTENKVGKFSRTGPQIQALFKELRHALKGSFNFSREEFLEVTEKASKFIFNYVIRPRWTLEKFIFRGETEIDKLSFSRAARFFSDYSYYLKGISEYLEFHKKNKLDVETWKKLHSKIDEQLLSMFPPLNSSSTKQNSDSAARSTNFESLVMPLYDLFQFASSDGTSAVGDDVSERKVPTDALILFFKDKSAAEIMDRLEFVREVKNVQSLDLKGLNMVLQAESKDVSVKVEVLPIAEEPPKEFKKFELPLGETIAAAVAKSAKAEGENDPGSQSRRPASFWDPFRQSNAVLQNSSEEVTPGQTMESHEENAKTPDPLLSEREKHLDQQLLFEPVETNEEIEETPSLRTYLTAKQESKIIRKIFGGSKSSYHVAIHKLDESSDWKGASKLVEGIFIENSIDPFSRYAVIFTEAVSKKFRHG